MMRINNSDRTRLNLIINKFVQTASELPVELEVTMCCLVNLLTESCLFKVSQKLTNQIPFHSKFKDSNSLFSD